MAPKREKNLFLITNNTHFLNVKTYIDTHPGAKNYVVLNIRRFPGHEEFCEKVEEDPDIELLDVLYVDQERKPPFHYIEIFSKIFRIKQLKKKHDFFEKIIFSNYNSWIQHFILKQYEPNQKVLLSDGTGILSIAALRKEDKTIPFKGSKFFIEKVLGLSPIKRLHFYSPWELDVASSDSVEVFKFKTSGASTVRKGKIFFVGSPLVELGYLEKQNHLDFLQRIKKQFENGDLFYFSHRREKNENLKDYKFFGKIIRDSMPFEERMEKEKELPEIVISYISSIFINLPQVYPKVKFYYRPLEDNDLKLNTNFKDRYNELAGNFKKMKRDNFKELELR